MAADYIQINRAKQLGNGLVRLAELIVEAQDLAAKLSAAKDHSFAAADYTMMESNFGLLATTGANTATLLGLVHEILNTNVDMTGALRLARLQEFTGRIAGQ